MSQLSCTVHSTWKLSTSYSDLVSSCIWVLTTHMGLVTVVVANPEEWEGGLESMSVCVCVCVCACVCVCTRMYIPADMAEAKCTIGLS